MKQENKSMDDIIGTMKLSDAAGREPTPLARKYVVGLGKVALALTAITAIGKFCGDNYLPATHTADIVKNHLSGSFYFGGIPSAVLGTLAFYAAATKNALPQRLVRRYSR